MRLVRQTFRVATELAVAQGPGEWAPPGQETQGAKGWDGWIHLTKVRAGSLLVPTGLLRPLRELLSGYGHGFVLQDARKRPAEFDLPLGPEIPLRRYQKAAVEAFERAGQGVWDMSPRAGKTLTGIEAHRRIAGRTVWLAPTKNIIAQTLKAYERWLGKGLAYWQTGVKDTLSGKTWRELLGHKCIFMSYATAADLPQEFWDTVEMLVVDEVHHGASQTLRDLLPKVEHVYWRLGMTGTFFRSGGDEMALHAFMSDTIAKVTAKELVEEGYLVPAWVAFVPLRAKTVRASGPGHAGVVKAGIVEHAYREDLTVWAARVALSRGKRVVILVAQKEQGERLARALQQHVPKPGGTDFHAVEFVSTNRPSNVNQAIITSFARQEEVRVLIGTSMIGEGTDLPPADCLIYAPAGSAEVSHRQAAYRVCTATGSKRFSVIIDFTDEHHDSLNRQAIERLSTYLSEPTFRTILLERVDYLPGFLDWLAEKVFLPERYL